MENQISTRQAREENKSFMDFGAGTERIAWLLVDGKQYHNTSYVYPSGVPLDVVTAVERPVLELKNITQSLKTPIEIALDVDGSGMTTAKRLYKFLELNPINYARWCKKKILDNEFAQENIDFLPFFLSEERDKFNPKPTTDYKLAASFAKKLAMGTNNERGEQAKNYFIAIEEKLRQLALKNTTQVPNQSGYYPPARTRTTTLAMNAATRQAELLYRMSKSKNLPQEQRNELVARAAALLTAI